MTTYPGVPGSADADGSRPDQSPAGEPMTDDRPAADAYGPGNSEALIGEALHPYAEGLVVADRQSAHDRATSVA